MPDLYHFWGEDLSVSPAGDLALVDGDDLTTQRIIRRLMTAAKGYIWHLDYGAGLPQRIGDLLDANAIRGVIKAQIALEEAVARQPAPKITVSPLTNGVSVTIEFASAITGQQTTLSFDVNN